jgi:hypothetical protein
MKLRAEYFRQMDAHIHIMTLELSSRDLLKNLKKQTTIFYWFILTLSFVYSSQRRKRIESI